MKTNVYTKPCPPTFKTTLFIVAKKWKQPTFLLADKWIKKMRSIDTMECYSAIKRTEVLIHVTT